MDRMYIVILVIYSIGLLVGGFIGYSMANNPLLNSENTIHVVIEPINDFSAVWFARLNTTDAIKEGFAIYYDDYFPNLHWKKDIVIANSMGDIISEAVEKANFVSSPVVIVCPKDFELAFKLSENIYPITNERVTFEYYGVGVLDDSD